MKRPATFCLVLLLSGVSGVANEDAAVPMFMAAEFKTHVTFLASDELAGRLPGSDGSKKAAKYILQAFDIGAFGDEEEYHPNRIRRFVFDGPFFVAFYEPRADHPYFAASIVNAELMEPFVK